MGNGALEHCPLQDSGDYRATTSDGKCHRGEIDVPFLISGAPCGPWALAPCPVDKVLHDKDPKKSHQHVILFQSMNFSQSPYEKFSIFILRFQNAEFRDLKKKKKIGGRGWEREAKPYLHFESEASPVSSFPFCFIFVCLFFQKKKNLGMIFEFFSKFILNKNSLMFHKVL